MLKLCADSIIEILEGKPDTGLARMSAALLDERQHQRIAEMRTLKLNEIREAWVDDMTREALAGV